MEKGMKIGLTIAAGIYAALLTDHAMGKPVPGIGDRMPDYTANTQLEKVGPWMVRDTRGTHVGNKALYTDLNGNDKYIVTSKFCNGGMIPFVVYDVETDRGMVDVNPFDGYIDGVVSKDSGAKIHVPDCPR